MNGKPDPFRILFVCLGNICRSPMAEGLFRHKVKEAGLQHQILTDSCGTSGHYARENPDPRMQRTARGRGIDISDLVARQLRRTDLDQFDLIIAMDRSNEKGIHQLGKGRATVKRMREWDENGGGPDVPDPWFGDQQGFEECFDLLDRCTTRLLEEVKARHL